MQESVHNFVFPHTLSIKDKNLIGYDAKTHSRHTLIEYSHVCQVMYVKSSYGHTHLKNPDILNARKASARISFNLQMCASVCSSPGHFVTAVIMPLFPSGVGALPPGTGESTVVGSGRVDAYCRAREVLVL